MASETPGQIDGIIAPLAHRYVAGVKARIREAQNERHFQYEITEKEAEARKASERSVTYQASHPRLVELKAAMTKPKGAKKKAAIGPFLGLLARTYTSDTSGSQSLQVQLKKKIKQVNLKLARRMRTSESDYNDQLVAASTARYDVEAPIAEEVEDTPGELEGSDAESVADDTEETSRTPLAEEVIEEDEDEDEKEEEEDEEDEEEEDEEVEEEEESDEGEEEEEEEEEEAEAEEDETEEEEAPIRVTPTKLCIRALKRMIIEEGI